MRLFEECPYVTPCGWCSRQNKPCEDREKRQKKGVIINKSEVTDNVIN